jgi:hypothetical protein
MVAFNRTGTKDVIVNFVKAGRFTGTGEEWPFVLSCLQTGAVVRTCAADSRGAPLIFMASGFLLAQFLLLVLFLTFYPVLHWNNIEL